MQNLELQKNKFLQDAFIANTNSIKNCNIVARQSSKNFLINPNFSKDASVVNNSQDLSRDHQKKKQRAIHSTSFGHYSNKLNREASSPNLLLNEPRIMHKTGSNIQALHEQTMEDKRTFNTNKKMSIKIADFNSISQQAINNINFKKNTEYTKGDSNNEQDRIIYKNLGKKYGSQMIKAGSLSKDDSEKPIKIAVLKKNSSNYTGFTPKNARISEKNM